MLLLVYLQQHMLVNQQQHVIVGLPPTTHVGGRRSPAVACWASDHWVASSNPLRGKFRH